jgi:hypothetical protein
MSNAQRTLSLAFLSLITENREAHGEEQEGSARGYLNDDSAWCWHDGCEGSIILWRILTESTDASVRLFTDDQGAPEDV